MTRYVALLRGINVGGKNLIKMTDLRECFEGLGFADVTTYIQSGNVVFGAKGAKAALNGRIEQALASAFDYDATVILRSKRQLQNVVARVPRGFGSRPAKYRYDVIFLQSGLSAAAVLKQVSTNPEVDTAHAGPAVLYFSRLIAKASRSRLSKLASLPLYQRLTVRNWNTTTRLLEML